MANLSVTVTNLTSSWVKLRQRWESSKSMWNDKVREDFERDYWLQLEQQVNTTQREMERLAQVISKARHSVK